MNARPVTTTLGEDTACSSRREGQLHLVHAVNESRAKEQEQGMEQTCVLGNWFELERCWAPPRPRLAGSVPATRPLIISNCFDGELKDRFSPSVTAIRLRVLGVIRDMPR